jgi:hypothetical protein
MLIFQIHYNSTLEAANRVSEWFFDAKYFVRLALLGTLVSTRELLDLIFFSHGS